MSTPSTKTVFFLGASGGVGLAALKHTLAAGHKCIALCRTTSKLTDILPADENPNLEVIQGNAHDVKAVASGLKKDDGTVVDEIVTTIGSRPSLAKLGGIEDPTVCRNGMATLLEAVAQVQKEGAAGKPLIVACSTTGVSRFGRDIPLAMVPLYHIMLKQPHEDKRIMEEKLINSGVDFTIVRPSLLTDGASNTIVRVGLEDPKRGRESEAIGYTISREDAGRWVAENLLVNRDAKYVNKVASITY
jgi:nucleoside-diphosphate-sugar epimerase